MTPDQLRHKLNELLKNWEDECVEFKDANDNYSTPEIGKYFSALSNEANLRKQDASWLVFGVDNKTRAVIGTSYREDGKRLHGLKSQISQGTDPSVGFREIHEVRTEKDQRVIMFEIPPAPRGTPIAWNGHFYARQHESLVALDLAKQDEIRGQGVTEDWSAVICAKATLSDLDPDAVKLAREKYIEKFGGRIPEATIRGWDDSAFLDKAKLTINGAITRAALLLLGKAECTHHLSPYVAELSWKLEGLEQAYEHFHPPFLLTTSLLYRRIRNIPMTILPPGKLLPIEVSKYDQRIVLEALHNCIAHQDYGLCERVLVTERVGELVFKNAGSFFDGKPEDYILRNRTPGRYRNRFLAEAMVNVRMIDTMGFGIREVMFTSQARRFFPLPEFDLSDNSHVILHLPGQFIDENYSRALIIHSDFTLDEIFALDRIQKGALPDESILQKLRKRGLVEGRKPAFHISASVAAATDLRADYIRTRRQDDEHYRHLIMDYLNQYGEAVKADLRRMLDKKWPELFSDQQKEHKLHNLLAQLKRAGQIEPVGPRSKGQWRRGALITDSNSGDLPKKIKA